MDNKKIVAAICRMTRKRPEDIQPHLSLGSLGISSSFGLSALRSLIEADIGRRLPPLRVGMQVGELDALATSNNAPITIESPLTPAIPSGGGRLRTTPRTPIHDAPTKFGLGMDMQEISTLPATDDFRTHPFYSSHFSPEEISTALLRQDPRTHLCGIFCAKEAAKKSHPKLLNLRMDDLCVAHTKAGQPLLRLGDRVILHNDFRFNLSITHTAHVAAATCLTTWCRD